MNNPSPTIIIGLTGGIGAGKSTAESFCQNNGIITADADRWAHDVLENNDVVINKIVNYFRQIHNVNPLSDNNVLNRKLIASIAFKNKKTIKFLEQLIHPIVRQNALEWIKKQRDNNARMAVLIVPLLLESKLHKDVDVVVVISSKVKIRINRLKETRDLSEKQVLSRIDNQMCDADRIKHADYIVENNSSIEEFRNKFSSVLNRIEKDFN